MTRPGPVRRGQLVIPGRKKPYLMAHRGNRIRCPENTRAAFQQALQDGADIIETDIRLTADRHMVCLHDADLDRTTDGNGPVAEMGLAQLMTLSASCSMTGFESERIPTAQEFLSLVPSDRVVALELKTDDFLDPAMCKSLADQIECNGHRYSAIILSFSWRRIAAMKRIAPHIPIGWVCYTEWKPVPEVDLLGPFWPLLMVNPFYVFLAHGRGQVVCPLDPAPDRRLWYYCVAGCDAVLSDDPGTTNKWLNRFRPLHALLHSSDDS